MKKNDMIHVYLADKGKLIQIQSTKGIETMPETVRHILNEYDKPQGTAEPVIKEVEKPLEKNQEVITISEKCLQLMTFDPNVKLLEKYKLTNISDLANAAMEKFLKDLK